MENFITTLLLIQERFDRTDPVHTLKSPAKNIEELIFLEEAVGILLLSIEPAIKEEVPCSQCYPGRQFVPAINHYLHTDECVRGAALNKIHSRATKLQTAIQRLREWYERSEEE